MQLPGRTDNEIKNYWNTRLKRRQRAGLPIYPIDIRPQNMLEFPQTNPSSSSLVSLLSSSHAQKSDFSTPMSIFDMFNPQPTMPAPVLAPAPDGFLSSSSYLSKNGLALSLSSVNSSPFSPPPFNHNNPAGLSQMPNYNSLNFGMIHSISSKPVSAGSSSLGLPSIQSVLASSESDYNTVIQTSSSDDNNHDETMEGFSQNSNSNDNNNHCNNSGLLGDLLGESEALTRATKAKEEINNNRQEADQNANAKFLWDYKLMEDAGVNENIILDQNYEENSSPPPPPPPHSPINS